MAVAIAVWSLDLVPGKEEVFVPQADTRISNACLGEQLSDQNGRTVVKVTYSTVGGTDSDEEEQEEDNDSTTTFVLCALSAGKAENAQVNLILEEGTAYKFELVGKNPVSLSGNYIDQVNTNQPPFSDEDGFDSDEEDAYDLRDVSSDVEADPEELDGIGSDASRFEEVEEEVNKPGKPGKRPREVDDADTEQKVAKADKKNKKLKRGDGEAVPVGKEETQPKPVDKKVEKEQKGKEEKKEKTAEGGVTELPGGLKYQDATTGEGRKAKKGDKLQMRYIGKLADGTIFDKNTAGKPFIFQLGAGEVIKGWDQGLVGMQVPGERILTCPPNFAYGKRGSPPNIPPNATLIFEVKLLAIKTK